LFVPQCLWCKIRWPDFFDIISPRGMQLARFLDPEQRELAQQIGSLLSERGQTVAVAEATAGGLISAALLSVPGASRYYGGGGVLYTLNSRIMLAGMEAEQFASYRGTTLELLAAMAESMRGRLGATWCVAESGMAGPTGGRSGAPPGRTIIGVAGPVSRTEVVETGLDDREGNMARFATEALRLLKDVLLEAGG
jgi:PncC family amidohydrolase